MRRRLLAFLCEVPVVWSFLFMDQAAEDITASELLGDQRLRLAIAF
jgi:hypothetical protein